MLMRRAKPRQAEILVSMQTACMDQVVNDEVKTWPKISVVMPSFNHAVYIERSLLSLINQGYPNLELILIDGGSIDGTVEVIRKYEQYIAYWVSEPDQGQSDALNKGFVRATGAILGWLNSDDIYMPGTLRIAAEALHQHPNKSIVFGDWLTIDENDNILACEYAFPMSVGQTQYEGVSINAQAMFWRRSVHDRFGEFDISLFNTMDYQMVLAFGLREGPDAFLCVHQPLCCFRRYEGQKTGAANYERQLGEHRYLAQRYGYADKYTTTGKVKRLVFRLRRAYWYVHRAGFRYAFEKLLGSIRAD